jgi:hypothetical protein
MPHYFGEKRTHLTTVKKTVWSYAVGY